MSEIELISVCCTLGECFPLHLHWKSDLVLFTAVTFKSCVAYEFGERTVREMRENVNISSCCRHIACSYKLIAEHNCRCSLLEAF